MNPKLKELRGKIEDRRKQLHDIFEEAGPDLDMAQVKCVEGDSAAKVEKIKSLSTELDSLVDEARPLEEEFSTIEKAKGQAERFGDLEEHPGHSGSGNGKGRRDEPTKSFGELFTDIYAKSGDADLSHLKSGAHEIEGVSVKTLMTTSAGWDPALYVTPQGPVVPFATRPVQVTDIIPHGSTSQSAVSFMEETTFTNNAAETAEAGTYPEAALALTERQSAVRKIAVWLPVTDEQLEDIPQVQGYINNRLPFMLRQRLDSQILVGDGNAPNLKGLLNATNLQTQAKGTDPSPDAIYKAMVKVRVTGRAMPGAVIYHPTNWQDIRLLRTADGIYIWGSPAEAGPERIWGLPVVQADGITLGTALVGDYQNFSELVERRGIELKVTDSHSTFFIEGKQAIRADVRVALVVYRGAAFCQVTGL